MYAGRKVEEASVGRAVRPPAASLHARACSARCRSSARRWPRADAAGWRKFPARCRACATPIVGCAFAGRCPLATELCRQRGAGRRRGRRRGTCVACHCTRRRRGGMSAHAARGHRPGEAFPGQGGLFGGGAARSRGRWRLASRIDRGETLSAGGRERLRQVHRRARRSCGCCDPTDGRGVARRASASTTCRERSCGRCAGACRWCSRTRSPASTRAMRVRDIIAEPIVQFRPRLAAAELEDRVAALMDKVRLPRDAHAAAAARVLRRPAPAHRHRARAGAGRRPDHLRRGGLGARRLGEGADRQPAAPTCRTSSGWRCCSSATTSRSSST